MGVYHNPGDSIECEKARVYTRKQVPSSIRRDPIIGVCIRYLCSLNASAEIEKELSPKRAKVDARSHLDFGDEIKGQTIEVFISGTKHLKFQIEAGFTGTHKVQTAITNSFTFARISIPFQNIIDSVERRPELLDENPNLASSKGKPIILPKKSKKRK